MKKIKYVAYHTPDQVYEQCAKQLKMSLTLAGIDDLHVEKIQYGDWSTACAYKPWFLAGAMMLFKEYDSLVYLDVDAIVVQYPMLFQEISPEYNIGVHFRDGKELLSGTIYLKNDPKTLELVFAWGQKCRDNPRVWDQRHLHSTLIENPQISVYELPENYCQIFDKPKNANNDTVIKHMQASRLSRGINKNHCPIQDRMLWTQ